MVGFAAVHRGLGIHGLSWVTNHSRVDLLSPAANQGTAELRLGCEHRSREPRQSAKNDEQHGDGLEFTSDRRCRTRRDLLFVLIFRVSTG